MPDVEIKLQPTHEGLPAISRNRPDDEFLMVDSHATDEGVLVLYEVRTKDPASVIRAFDDVTELHSYEVLHTGERVVLIQCSIDDPAPFRAARSSGSLARTPPVLRDGWINVKFTTSNESLSRYVEELEARGVTYHILSVIPSSDSTDDLTDRQREVIAEAVDQGYYETPRRCSLTELAADLGVTKGTTSRILHRAEGTIITEFVSAARVSWTNDE